MRYACASCINYGLLVWRMGAWGCGGLCIGLSGSERVQGCRGTNEGCPGLQLMTGTVAESPKQEVHTDGIRIQETT